MSTHRKEDFWIGAKGGLIEWKHYKRMGKAVWLFLHLLRCQTALSQHGEGVVYYGHAITLESIRRETKGFPVRTLKQWVIRLRQQGYIRTEDHGCKGLVFWITKGKHKTWKRTVDRVKPPIIRKTIRGFGHVSVPVDNRIGRFSAPITAQAGQEHVPIETEECPQVAYSPEVAAESVSATPKGFTPKNLSNHNNASAAQTAAERDPAIAAFRKKCGL
jgi:hypothetical protein